MLHKIKNENLEDIITEKNQIVKYIIVELNGKEIKNKSRFLDIVEKKYKFPNHNINWNGFFDWMRDLEWLNKREHIIIITTVCRRKQTY